MKELHGRILRWGNSLGIRLRKEDAERLGLHVGDEVDLLLPEAHSSPPLPTFDLGGAADRHDELFGADAAEDLG